MFRCYILDYHNFAKPEDRAYISRGSRANIPRWKVDGRGRGGARGANACEKGRLEATARCSGGYAVVAAIGLTIRILLRTECIPLGPSINPPPPLEPTDPHFDWINRGFDRNGGVCKDPRLRPARGLMPCNGSRRGSDRRAALPSGPATLVRGRSLKPLRHLSRKSTTIKPL